MMKKHINVIKCLLVLITLFQPLSGVLAFSDGSLTEFNSSTSHEAHAIMDVTSNHISKNIKSDQLDGEVDCEEPGHHCVAHGHSCQYFVNNYSWLISEAPSAYFDVMHADFSPLVSTSLYRPPIKA